jgi:CRP/FNR family transcriptional regulator
VTRVEPRAPARDDTLAALAAAAPGWPAALRETVAARAGRLSAPDGHTLFSPGEACRGFVVVLSGSVRVEHTGPSGRTVKLYRVGPGETCVVTTACLMTEGQYPAWGIAEGAVEALALPPGSFATLMRESEAFRAMALGVFATRLTELVEVIDELLLHRVDLRLAAWLAAHAPAVQATHQVVASELGSAREVVSRILKDFERRGWVGLARGEIAVRDAAALQRFADDGRA